MRHPRLRVALGSLCAELPFVVLGPAAYLRAIGVELGAEPFLWAAALQGLKHAVVVPFLWRAGRRLPIAARANDLPAGELEAAHAEATRLPGRVGTTWAVLWGLQFPPLLQLLHARGLVDAGPGLGVATGLMSAATCLAAFVLLVPVLAALVAPEVSTFSVALGRAGVPVRARALSLRRTFLLIALALALAPATWMAGMAHLGATDPVTLGLFLGIAALWAVLGAHFVSRAWADPVARMERVIADIIRRGVVVDEVERVPVYRGDELGRLAEGVNAMVSRLAKSTSEVNRHVREVERLLARADAALRTRDAFVSVAAHELRTPLTTLALSVDALHAAADSGRAAPPAAIDRARRQVRRLSVLVNDLLDVNRIQTGRLALQRQRVGLATLARDVAESFKDVSGAHRVEVEVPEEEVEVEADRGRLEQVLTNLLDNAIKYSPDGGTVRVRVSAHGPDATVAISDQGIGVEPDEQALLFTTYFRGRNASQRQIRGVGLGLFITRSIVEAHGGRILVESHPGAGTTFQVELPRLAPTPGQGHPPPGDLGG